MERSIDATTARRDRWDARLAWAAWLPALGTAIAVLLVPAPPFVDYGWHLAVAEIYADFDGVPAYQQAYALRGMWGPNVLYHALAVASRHPAAVTPVLLALGIVSTVAVALALGRRYRAGPVYALTAGLFAIHYSTGLGFLEFTLGVPVALLVVLVLSAEPPARRGARAMAGWAMLLACSLIATFLAHAILCCFTLGIVGLFAMLRFRASRAAAIAAALAATPTLAALLYWKAGRPADPSGAAYLLAYYRIYFAIDLPDRLRDWFVLDHHWLISTTVGPWLAAGVFALAMLATLIVALRPAPTREAARDDRRPPIEAVQALAMVSIGIALFAPPEYPPVYALYQRFVFAMVIGVALWAGARSPRASPPRALVVTLAIVNAALGGLMFEHVWSFGPTARDVVTLATETKTVRLDGVGAYVVGDPRWRGEPIAMWHAASYMTTFGHRPVMTSMFDFAGSRVATTPAFGDARYGRDGAYFANVDELLSSFDHFGWALVHDSAPAAGRAELERVAPIVARRGAWAIYARPPATSPTTTMPTARPALTGTGP